MDEFSEETSKAVGFEESVDDLCAEISAISKLLRNIGQETEFHPEDWYGLGHYLSNLAIRVERVGRAPLGRQK